MPNYNESKIYKIVDNTNGNVYIGSTTEKYLCRRLASHVVNYHSYEKGNRRFTSSFDIIKNGNYEIFLLELVNASSKDELHKRERYFIESIPCINIRIPSRPQSEYMKIYRADNSEKIQEYARDHYVENKLNILRKYACECGCESAIKNKYRHEKTQKHQLYIKSLTPSDGA